MQQLGINPELVDDTSQFPMLFKGSDELGNIYRYVKASSTGITAAHFVVAGVDGVASLLTKTLADSYTFSFMGVPVVAIGGNKFGWIQVEGLTHISGFSILCCRCCVIHHFHRRTTR